MLGDLSTHFAIDLFHDANAFPNARFGARGFGGFDHRLFERVNRVRPYRAVFYQMGNSPAHFFVYERLLKTPGVVELHDLALGSFHYERSIHCGGGLGTFREALERSHPSRHGELAGRLAKWSDAPEAMVAGLTAAGFDMNGAIVDAAGALIVHSRGALERLGPGASAKGFIVPLGANTGGISATERAQARARLGLPEDALVVGTFGIVHRSKLNAEAVSAFEAVARANASAVLLVVGEEADGGEARARAHSLGLGGRVRFLGRPDDAGFREALAATDLGLALRRPPTNGESSAALLDLLRAGVATIVTDTGSFRELPDDVVRKVAWEDDARGAESLREALLALASDRSAREALGRVGQNYVAEHLAWPRVAKRYAEVIDWWIERASTAGGERCEE